MSNSGQCLLCDRGREAEWEFCNLHRTAKINLETEFAAWSRAFGGKLTKQEYWAKLEALNETGGAVKEVIKNLREKGIAN